MMLKLITQKMKGLLLTGAIFALAMTFVLPTAEGQLDNLLKKTTRKLGDQIERMAVEKLSDVIARKAAEKIENEFDKMLAEAIEQDTTADDSLGYKAGKSYAQFLKGLNDAADVPEKYHFDFNILMEVKSEDEDPESIRMFYSKTEPLFAIQTATSEEEGQLIVMDVENDVTVLYQTDGDKKTAQAIPNMFGLASSMANEEIASDFSYEINPIKKRKKFAGYKCDGYEGVLKDEEANTEQRFETWLTTELGTDWRASQGAIVERFAPHAYQDQFAEVQGIPLMSQTFEGKKGKLTSSMEAKEVDTRPFDLVNADYDFGHQKASQ